MINMRTLATAMSLFTTLSIHAADECSAVLSSDAFDRTEFSQSTAVYMSKKDALCDKQYSSKGDMESAASSSGLGLGIGQYKLDWSQATQTAANSYSIKSTDFCKASSQQISELQNTVYKQQVASTALAVWLECIKTTKEDRLFLRFEPRETGRGFSAFVHRRPGLESEFGSVKGVEIMDYFDPSTSPNSARRITCSLEGKTVATNGQWQEPYRLTKGITSFGCTKPPSASAIVVLLTSRRDFELRSRSLEEAQTQARVTDLNALAQRVATINEQQNLLQRSIAETRQQIDSSIQSNARAVEASRTQLQAEIKGVDERQASGVAQLNQRPRFYVKIRQSAQSCQSYCKSADGGAPHGYCVAAYANNQEASDSQGSGCSKTARPMICVCVGDPQTPH